MAKNLNLRVLKHKLVTDEEFVGNYFYGDELKDEKVRVALKGLLNNFEKVCESLDVFNLTYPQAVSRLNFYCDYEISRAVNSKSVQ